MSMLEQLKGEETTPVLETFKVGPEKAQSFISKLLVVMGADIEDIKNIEVSHDRKKLVICATVDRNSNVFTEDDVEEGGLSMLGSAQKEEFPMSLQAKAILKEFGYFYYNDGDESEPVYAVTLEETKKNILIKFNTDITYAIITDTNFLDQYFAVDVREEVVYKKKENRKKFKGKKQTIVFASVERGYQDVGGYDPEQVLEFFSDNDSDDDEE